MRLRGYALLPAIFLMSLTLLAAHDAAAATTPGFSITASNVSVSDTGSGSSAYTVTSVGGFTGQVAVSCFAPELDGALVLPDCDIPQQFLTIPANGSASGKMPFTPPSNVTAENKSGHERRSAGPLAAGALMLAGFAAARRRLRWNRHSLCAPGCWQASLRPAAAGMAAWQCRTGPLATPSRRLGRVSRLLPPTSTSLSTE